MEDLKKKIDALLQELRSWDPLEPRATVLELVNRYGLDPFVVRRLANSEGVDLDVASDSGVPEETSDPAADTTPIERDSLPETDADFEDQDTGVWHQERSTGEWTLQPPKK